MYCSPEVANIYRKRVTAIPPRRSERHTRICATEVTENMDIDYRSIDIATIIAVAVSIPVVVILVPAMALVVVFSIVVPLVMIFAA
jgi:hypothetical protein